MIGRSRRVRLKNDIEFDTPLLVPALSSMAIGPVLHQKNAGSKPRLTPCSIVHSEFLVGAIEEVLLISAYDIHHQLLVESETLYSGFANSRYASPRFLIIDSGWYEKTKGPAGGVFAKGLDQALEWEESRYERTLNQLDDEVRAVAVSWDYDGPYSEQIARAQSFFGGQQRFGSTILLKRPKDCRFHNLQKLSGEDVANLRVFDIVGVTEKELGDTLLDRLEVVAKLRSQLDDFGVSAPIHVFGGLDPLFTPLYFAAGGEVFDGLGWLRYFYQDGVAVNRDAAAVQSGQVDMRWMKVMGQVQIDNLNALRVLAGELRVFAHKGEWTKLRKGDVLLPIYERLEERLVRHHGR